MDAPVVLTDSQGNELPVGGEVSVVQILTEGTPIASIGGKIIYAPQLSEEDVEVIEEFGNSMAATQIAYKQGSYYQSLVYNFKAGIVYEVYLKSSSAASILFYGLEDAEDTSQQTYQFKLDAGSRILWTPTKDFEALRYGVNGSSEVVVYAYDGLANLGLNHVFFCGHNRTLNTLKAGIEEATKYMDSVLYVDDGEYDLIEEFGNEYFASLNSNSTMSGLQLKNRIKVVFSPNARVLCHYTGDNQYVKSLFSPFNSAQFGFELVNLHLECSNVRYGVHDERNGGKELCRSWYKNCYIELDNTNNTAWVNASCIGGGLGSNHSVNIEGCYFKPRSNNGQTGVYWHNSNDNSNSDFSSYLVIANNYVDGGTINIQSSRNDSSKYTYIFINGNNLSANPVLEITNKTIVKSWNNTIEA